MTHDVDARATADVVIVGAGAAGLATAIFTRRAAATARVLCVDGAKQPGAKILVSGGSRCNVTNRRVEAADFWGGSARVVTRVLRAFSAARTVAFFDEIGVALHEEEDGKLFPDTNRARTVLDALLREADACGVSLRSGCRVVDVCRLSSGFVVSFEDGQAITADRVVLATGGRSLPKSGSDGFGYALARRLGHGHVDTTPALAPLILDGDRHRTLAGIAHHVSLTCGDGRARTRLEGSLLWTHFGISGPVALNASRHWHRARLEGRAGTITLNVCPGYSAPQIDEWLLQERQRRPRAQVQTVIATRLPAAVASEWCRAAGIAGDCTMSHITRTQRMALVSALVDTPLQVRDSRGYSFAEATAGGVPLDEIDPSSMESRRCPGLHVVGEILDVDGRLGGFNFQWAWSSAWVAGGALASGLRPDPGA
jgi:predicted Rossmann fold flavoprotein